MPKVHSHTEELAERRPIAAAGALRALSARIARIERAAAGLLLAAVVAIVLANVVGRTIGAPLIWADELAIYGMAWIAFIAGSAALAGGEHIAITLLPDALSEQACAKLSRVVDLVLLALLAALAAMLWTWFDPVGYLSAASAADYARSTFNFMHQEPTVTLGVRKIWFWLALPIFNVTAAIHVLARLIGGSAK